MGRLIDADVFYKRYCEMYEDGVDEGEIDRIAYMLSTEPDAYDVEKVVEQLKENSHTDFSWSDHVELDKAIEIVRKGGVE